MYVFVLIILTTNGTVVVPSPMPRFQTEEQCIAYAVPRLDWLKKMTTKGLPPMGVCVELRKDVEGIPA